MSLQSEIANLSTRIAAEFNTIRSEMESVSNPYTSVGSRVEFTGNYFYRAFLLSDNSGYKATRSLIGSNPVATETATGSGAIPTDLTALTYN